MEELKSLVISARSGSLEAFGRIVRRFQDMAYGCAYSVLGDFHLSEDIAQEAFIEAYCQLSSLRDPEAFPGWFRRIVFKHCDRITRRKHIQTVPLDAAARMTSGDAGPALMAEQCEMQEEILEAIRALPEHLRTVTMLFYIDEYSQKEVAEFLGVPVTTVKKRLYDSRRQLRERMGVKMPKQTPTQRTRRANFWKVFGLMAASGSPLMEILDIAPQAGDKELKGAASDVRESLAKGTSLSDAMAEHRETFSAFEVTMVRAGESSGSLDTIAGKLAEILTDVEFPLEGKEQDEPAEPVEEVTPVHPVVDRVNSLLIEAVDAGASDIHIDSLAEHTRIRFRIDGTLKEIEQIPESSTLHRAVVSRLKIMAGMDFSERRLPQDGLIQFKANGKEYHCRVATVPSSYGESVTIRMFRVGDMPITLDRLGLVPKTLKAFKNALSAPYGLVLVTGPTGSGKSTTLYAALDAINTLSLKVFAIVDDTFPDIPGVIRGTVNKDIGLTYAEMLRSVMRHDPDVILVGELRDKETALMAIEAALTGHLVLSTLSTNDSVGSLAHLLEMGVTPRLVAGAIRAVLAQRLARRLCPQCREAVETPEQVRQVFAECHAEVPDEIYRAVGCDACKGGYKGRIAIHELLIPDAEVRKLVDQQAFIEEIYSAARKAGMRTLKEDGMKKAASGITSVEEVLRIT